MIKETEAKGEEEQIELIVSGLTQTNLSLWNKIIKRDNAEYHLILSVKEDPTDKVIMVIGTFEAQAIAIALEKLIPTRPLIQDLFKNCVDIFGYSLDKVLINKLDDGGVFYTIIYYSNEHQQVKAEARTADAIALALRHNSPIFMNKTVLSKNRT